MLPGNTVSSITAIGRLQYPDGLVLNDLTDYEWGGIALNDASQGLLVKPWVCRYEGTAFIVDSDGTEPQVIYERAGVNAIAFTFDQNMRPILAFEDDGEMWLWWWDSQTNSRQTTNFGRGRNVRLTLDDKRANATTSGTNDVLFAYIRDDRLCYRQQRERYQFERVLRTGVSPLTRLKNVGMGDNLRIRFQLV